MAKAATKNGFSMTVDASAVLAMLEAVPKTVARRALLKAVKESVKPVLSAAKMQIARSLSGDVKKKGVADYKRSMIVTAKTLGKTGAVGRVGADMSRAYVSSSHIATKGSEWKMTRWARLASMFEFGAVGGRGGVIKAGHAIQKTMDTERRAIMKRFQDRIVGDIAAAARRHGKLKSKGVVK